MRQWIVRFVVLALWAVTMIYVFGAGAIIGKHRAYMAEGPIQMVGKVLTLLPQNEVMFCEGEELTCGENDVTARRPVPCDPFSAPDPRRAVLFTFGQSNAANEGRDRYLASDDVINFNPFDGKCYIAQDPLLGAYGEAGSVWGRVGDGLIEAGAFDQVLIVPIAIGGTSIERWAKGGGLNPRITFALQAMAAKGLRPTHILWHQGEADRIKETTTARYVEQFGTIVETFHAQGVDAPLYPAVATYCYMFDLDQIEAYQPAIDAVRTAQQRLPDHYPGVRPGPDTDRITGAAYRPDNCHFTHLGLQAHADLWVKALTAK
ncbi:MAG: sialate O-acetylesterase [Alphaproteobacteria bacterium]